MENTNVLFDRKRLVRLIVPLIVEQVLAVTVGMADMVMVSGAGETAVSGISLVNTICVLLIVIFTSMASGGSVVGAQFLGSGDKKTACHAAEQLVMICGLIAQQEARRMKEENYEVVVFQGDPGTIDLTYEEIEAEWNKMLQSVPQIGKFRIIHQGKKRYIFEDYSSQIGNADAALGIWVHKGVINEKLFEAHPNLKYIATLGHGFEDFDVEMTRRRGVTITNTIYGDVTIAQYAMALLMNICHNVTVQSDYTKTGYWKEKETNPQASYNQLFVPQIELYQKTLGIIIDEEALLEALESRKVYMAGLDVVANEPPQYQIPLMQSPYTFITSHIAWQPKAARLRAVDLAVKNFRSYLEGMPTSVIN
jgi:lactate dehydrogenase-like 2-hydroxyacid dehydrogenase